MIKKVYSGLTLCQWLCPEKECVCNDSWHWLVACVCWAERPKSNQLGQDQGMDQTMESVESIYKNDSHYDFVGFSFIQTLHDYLDTSAWAASSAGLFCSELLDTRRQLLCLSPLPLQGAAPHSTTARKADELVLDARKQLGLHPCFSSLCRSVLLLWSRHGIAWNRQPVSYRIRLLFHILPDPGSRAWIHLLSQAHHTNDRLGASSVLHLYAVVVFEAADIIAVYRDIDTGAAYADPCCWLHGARVAFWLALWLDVFCASSRGPRMDDGCFKETSSDRVYVDCGTGHLSAAHVLVLR